LSTEPEPNAEDPRLLRRFAREFVRPHAGRFAVLAPLVALAALTSGGYVLVVKWAGDQVQQGDATLIYQVPAWVLGLTALRAAALYGQAVATSDLVLRCLRDLQSAMFSALLRADYARIRREPAGALVARFTNDLQVLTEGLVRSFGQLARDALTLAAALGAILIVDWLLAVLVLGVFALAAGPLQKIAKRARQDSKAAQLQMGDLASALAESFAGAAVVRAHGLEERERRRLSDRFEARRKLLMRLVRNRARSDPMLEVLGGLAAAGVFVALGLRLAAGAITTGDLLAFIAAIATASSAARGLGTYNTVLNESRAALARAYGVLDEGPRVVERPGATRLDRAKGEIRFEDVWFGYDGSDALRGVSFVARPGETVAIVGPSGAGKSSLLQLTPRLYDVASGQVRIDGADVRDLTLASLRAQIAYVGQEAVLFDDTVRANLLLAHPAATDAALWAALEGAAAAAFVQALPMGLESPVGPGGSRLSGGERQRLALARALLRDAPILLLDEPTAALDAESERHIQEALARAARGRTTLVIAHRLATVRRADQILVLEQGRIVERGDHDSLLAQGGLYAKLCRLQFLDPLTPGATPDPPARSPSLG